MIIEGTDGHSFIRGLRQAMMGELSKQEYVDTVEAYMSLERLSNKIQESCLMPVNTDTEEYYQERIQYIKTQLKHTKKDYEKISLQKELGRLEKKLRVLKLRKEN